MKLLISPPVGEMAGKPEGHLAQTFVKGFSPPRTKNLIQDKSFLEMTVLHVAPLWPAGHLPRKGGDQPS